jgi:hypothetical protein
MAQSYGGNSFSQRPRHPLIVEAESRKAPQAVVMDYVNRTQPSVAPADERKIIFEDTRNVFNPVGITYEESVDVAKLYQPVQGTQKTGFVGARVIPGFESLPLPPIKNLGTH